MGIVLSLGAALLYGSGDFFGGRASRDASTISVLLVAQVIAMLGALVVVLFTAPPFIGHDLMLGMLAGSANVVGLGLLYAGLASGRMGVVAPVTAAVAAVVPVTWAVITGERPSTLVSIGVVCAIVAAVLIGRERDTAAGSAMPALLLAIGSGAGLGASFIFYAETVPQSGMWPLLSARVVGVVLVGLVTLVLVARRVGSPVETAAAVEMNTGGVTPDASAGQRFLSSWVILAVIAGLADVTATLFLIVAVRGDLAVVVAPIIALAPAFTVVLAWQVLHERIGRTQLAGLVLAAAGVVLIAIS